MVTPLVTGQIEDSIIVGDSSPPTIFPIDLTEFFDDPSTTGQIARFEFADNINNGGVVDVLLFDQSGVGAPETVENFLNYVEDGDYDDSIIHRSVADFIVQGGGFAVEDSQVIELSADEAVINEFSAERSNLEGTIAMAKLGGDPDSATNQWFFNLGDNSENLDNQNGGFTVFGQVLDESELESIEAIADFELVNGVPVVDSPLTLDNVPITDSAAPIDTDDFVGLESVTLLSEDELEFSVVSNSNEELVEASITDSELMLDYVGGEAGGEATITLEATNLLGESVEESFVVTVEEDSEPTTGGEIDEEVIPSIGGMDVFRFLDPDTGIHFYANSEAERDELIANEPNYQAEGAGYGTVPSTLSSVAEEVSEVFSFFNNDTGAYLYTVDENEKEFIEENLDNYTQESDSFSVFAEEPDNMDSIPIYRFLNTDTGAHFYTSSVAERDVIEDNLPNYNSEGIAFYAFETGE